MALTEKQKLIVGVTVGIACLVLIVLAIIIVALCLDHRRRRRRASIIEYKEDSIASDYNRSKDVVPYNNQGYRRDGDYYDDRKYPVLPGHSYIPEDRPTRPPPQPNYGPEYAQRERSYIREPERVRTYVQEIERPPRPYEVIERPREYEDRYQRTERPMEERMERFERIERPTNDRVERFERIVERPYEERVERYEGLDRSRSYDDRIIMSPGSLPYPDRSQSYRQPVDNVEHYSLSRQGVDYAPKKKFDGNWLDRHYFKTDLDNVNKNAMLHGRDPFLWRPIKTWGNAYDK